ncbi:MAG: hypothetical protein MJE77_04990 [Proteobacteria bacterium]|nr:hypothetical protein [Pseudomonadota bacterium]
MTDDARIPLVVAAVVALSALAGGSGCALINGLAGSSDDLDGIDADGSSDCLRNPQRPGCRTFTCESPHFLGLVDSVLVTDVDTCGTSSSVLEPICPQFADTVDMVIAFDWPSTGPYRLCVGGSSGGTIAVMPICPDRPPDDVAPCLASETCIDAIPFDSGPQFLLWESFGGGACGTLELQVSPARQLEDAGSLSPF